MRELVNESTLAAREKHALLGSLSGLTRESFGFALTQYVDSIKDPAPIEGLSILTLVTKSVDLRNRIAHKPDPIDPAEIQLITRITTICSHNDLDAQSFAFCLVRAPCG
jgi:hypothetical protein